MTRGWALGLVQLILFASWGLITASRSTKIKHGQSNKLNDRPIIGILSQAYFSDVDQQVSKQQYVAASYVKFIESAGAQVVPVFNNLTTEQYTELFSSLNGVLFPGGAVSLSTSGYFHAASTFYHLAVTTRAADNLFPIWGTCLGFQALTVLGAGENLLSHFDAEDLNLPLNLTTDALEDSRLFAHMPSKLVEAITTRPLTFNHHHFGITPAAFLGNSKLREGFHILSTNVDRAGKPFVSTMEHRSLPFFGIQWHTEKNTYEWNRNEPISHDPDAIAVTQFMANFFVEQARLSQHHFPSSEAEQKALIYNWHTTHNPLSDFEEIYLW